MIFARKHHLGIDLGDSEVKAVLLRKKPRGWLVESVFRHPVTGDDNQSRAASRDDALKKIARAARGAAPSVTLGMPAAHSALKVIQLPPADRRAIEQVLQFEADQHIPFRADNAEMDFDLLGRPTDDAQAVALAACDKGVLNGCLSALRAGALRPRAVDVGVLGVANCFANRPVALEVAEPDGVLIADLGARRTAMVVLQHGAFHSHRVASFGCDSLTEAIADDFDVAPPEAEALKRRDGVNGSTHHAAIDSAEAVNVQLWLDRLAAELRVMIQSYRAATRTGQITRVLLTGGGALTAGLAEALSRRVRLEIFVPDVWGTLEVAEGVDVPADAACAFACATGLAIRADRPLVRVNLSPTLSREAIAARKERTRWVAVAAAAAVVLLAAGLYFHGRLSARRGEVIALKKELLQYKPADEDGQSKLNLAAISRRAAQSRYNGRLWLELLQRFSTDLPEGVWLDEAHFDSNGTVNIRGAAKTHGAVKEAVSTLGRMAAFSDVKLTYANSVKRGDQEVVQFQTVCTIRGEGEVAS